jgi:hypothetical protein
VSPNYLVTFVDASLLTKFPRFWPASPAQHTDFPSSDVDGERSPALIWGADPEGSEIGGADPLVGRASKSSSPRSGASAE